MENGWYIMDGVGKENEAGTKQESLVDAGQKGRNGSGR